MIVIVLIALISVIGGGGGGGSSSSQRGAKVLRYSITSKYLRSSLPQTVVIPPGTDGRGRPLLVFLHAEGDTQDSYLTTAMFSALAAQGSKAPDVVFPNGGSESFWHNRRAGRWASYVVHEVIPRAIAETHADGARVAIGGISMGGFGAYGIARSEPGHFCAVGGHSPALWLHFKDASTGAFDDAKDFSSHDLIALASRSNPYASTQLWLDVGSSDPFRAADQRFAQDLTKHGAAVRLTTYTGGHDSAYWNAHWPAYMTFYARALAVCHS